MKQQCLLKRAFLAIAIALVALFPVTHEGTLSSVAASGETTPVASIDSTTLDQKLQAILKDPKLQGGITGVSVRKADTGEAIFSHFGDIRLRPASNMKLLTGSTAMDILGPDYQFSTEVLTDGQVKGKMIHGNLYLKGKGDPTLMKKDLDQFAKDLKAKGIDKINGNLIADDSWYDDVRYSQDLNWSDEHNYIGAQVSALTLSPNEDYDAGTVIVEVNPGNKAGDLPKVTLTPETSSVVIVNNATTVAKGEAKSISIAREHGTNRIIIKGKMPLEGTRSQSWSAVWDPSMLALDVFQKSLTAEGIQLVGNGGMKTGQLLRGQLFSLRKNRCRLASFSFHS